MHLLPLIFLPLFLTTSPALGAELRVYAYDSFTAKGGLGQELKRAFTEAQVKLVTFPSAGEALNQIALEGARTKADLLVGVDQGLFGRAAALDAFLKLEEKSELS